MLSGETTGTLENYLEFTFAGSGTGLFSEIIGGWANGDVGSKPVTRAVTY